MDNNDTQLNLLDSAQVSMKPSAVAKINGEVLSDFPDGLYIPPRALKIFLEAFEGPLDLLLYLIRKQHIDVLDLPMESITKQYLEYITLMQTLQLELAAEYLVMAATLTEIKSRLLLPRPVFADENGEEDPRVQLIRRLQEYEQFKMAAEELDTLPRLERDIYLPTVKVDHIDISPPLPNISLEQLCKTLRDVFNQLSLNERHIITREVLSVHERMSILLSKLDENKFTKFTDLLSPEEGKMGVVVTFVAMMELSRQSVIKFIQSEPFASIYLQKNMEN